MDNERNVQLKAVYTIVERPGVRSRWVRIGIGFVNHDGSINVKLDAVPVNGTLHIRNHQRRVSDGEEPQVGSNETSWQESEGASIQ